MEQNRGAALVTGASSGIGRECAMLLAARGYDLALVSRNAEALGAFGEELERAYGVRAAVIPADLSREGAAETVHESCRARGIEVDVLVNNAGAGFYGEVAGMPAARIQELIMLDAVALTQLCALFGADMRARGHGRILNVSSLAGRAPVPYAAVYSASKAYVTAFSRVFREELRLSGVTVSCLHPGMTRTGFFEAAGGREVGAFLLMEPRTVAEAGIRGLFRGNATITPGLLNKLGYLCAGMIPARLTGWYMRRSIGREAR